VDQIDSPRLKKYEKMRALTD